MKQNLESLTKDKTMANFQNLIVILPVGMNKQALVTKVALGESLTGFCRMLEGAAFT